MILQNSDIVKIEKVVIIIKTLANFILYVNYSVLNKLLKNIYTFTFKNVKVFCLFLKSLKPFSVSLTNF